MTLFARLLLTGVLALGGGALPPAALAVDAGPYVSLAGMYVLPIDSEYTGSTSTGEINGDIALKGGGGVVVAFGYETGTGPRIEAEFGYRSVDGKNVTFNTPVEADIGGSRMTLSSSEPLGGELTTFSFMANGYYAGDLGGGVRPYLGGGIGLALIEDETYLSILGSGSNVSVDDTVFAYQAMVGVGYGLMENVEVRLGYRFFGTTEGEFGRLKASYYTNNFEAGIAYRF